MKSHRNPVLSVGAAVLAAGAALLLPSSCGKSDALGMTDPPAGAVSGEVHIDGSSTVLPISEAVAEEYLARQPKVRVTVSKSGTGGGFKKFIRGEIDINDASRPIKPSELESCGKAGIDFLELAIAYDGIAVVVNPKNDFVDELSVEQLKKIWNTGSTVKTWADVDPSWPARPIKLFGPGVDSGTFDYFTEVVNGKAAQCRADFTASEDDHVLVQGVSGEADALGFFGFAYYDANADKLKLLTIKGDGAPTKPSTETIADGSYAPLSRPLFIYVRKAALERKEVENFVEFYLDNASELAAEVGYVGLPEAKQALVRGRFDLRTPGRVLGEK